MPSKRVKMVDSIVDADYVRAHFWYDPATGFLYRKSTNRPFGTLDRKGYLRGLVKGTSFFAHRLVWLYNFGEWPAQTLDHVNHNKADNRLCNLRPASFSQNNRNVKIRRTNTSGVNGVWQYKRSKNWGAWVVFEGCKQLFGTFKTIEEATIARMLAAEKMHGAFVHHGKAH